MLAFTRDSSRRPRRLRTPRLGFLKPTVMQTESKIELGMKVAVRCGVLEHIGVVVRIEDEHVVVRGTQPKELSDELEFRAHRDDVRPLSGWI